jgi:hypothetical protein
MNNFGRKMSNEGSHIIHNLIILDESGSMASLRRQTLEGIASVFTTIREGMEKFPEQNHRVSLLSFASGRSSSANHKFILWNEPVDKIPVNFANAYRPEGGTPLFDAIGAGLAKMRADLASQSHDSYNVLVTIITDGEENSSTEYSYDQIRNLIGALSEGSWTFAFIGAGLDAYDVARSLNIANALAFVPDENGLKDLFMRTKVANERYMASMSRPNSKSSSSKITGLFDEDKVEKQ